MKRTDLLSKAKEDKEFQDIIKDIIENEEFQKTKNFKVHGNTTIFAHSYAASYFCYLACKKRKLDYRSAARGALLHDFYLYDWRVKDSHVRPHAFTHPLTSYLNAKKQFTLNWMEKDMILTHMWPVTLFTIPLCREGWILTMIDKSCATIEFFDSLQLKIKKRIFNQTN